MAAKQIESNGLLAIWEKCGEIAKADPLVKRLRDAAKEEVRRNGYGKHALTRYRDVLAAKVAGDNPCQKAKFFAQRFADEEVYGVVNEAHGTAIGW